MVVFLNGKCKVNFGVCVYTYASAIMSCVLLAVCEAELSSAGERMEEKSPH